jgi:hypothetical protein
MVPDFYPSLEEKKPKKEDDDLLLSMAESKSWETLKNIIESIQDNLKEQAKEAAGNAESWELVGKIYYGRDVAIDAMQSIIDIVDLRKEYAESTKQKE